MSNLNEFQAKLSEPFAPTEVKWKAQATTKDKTKAAAVAYVDARTVMDRLDASVGPGGWSDTYHVLPNGKNVECVLTVLGVSKSDVGEPNEGGFSDLMKGAYSDAFKRAAVKFGISRYLYSIPVQWVAYNAQKKQLVQPPKLPTWALPSVYSDKPATAAKPDHLAASNEIASAVSFDDLKPATRKPANGGGVPLSFSALCDRIVWQIDHYNGREMVVNALKKHVPHMMREWGDIIDNDDAKHITDWCQGHADEKATD